MPPLLESINFLSMQEGCEFCDFSAKVLALFACRPRLARAMAIVLQGGWFGGESRWPHPATCTCGFLLQDWDRYVDLLLESEDDVPDGGVGGPCDGAFDDASDDGASSS